MERQWASQKSHDINKRITLQKKNENFPEIITVSTTALATAQCLPKKMITFFQPFFAMTHIIDGVHVSN